MQISIGHNKISKDLPFVKSYRCICKLGMVSI